MAEMEAAVGVCKAESIAQCFLQARTCLTPSSESRNVKENGVPELS